LALSSLHNFKIFYPLKGGIPFAIKDDGFYFCSDDTCELFCHLSIESMTQGDSSLKPLTEDFLFGGDNHKNEITIVKVNSGPLTLWNNFKTFNLA